MLKHYLILFLSLFTLHLTAFETHLSGRLKQEDLAPLKGQCRMILLRHGETQWNAEGKSQGWADIPLNEEGKKQSRELRDQLLEVEVKTFYASALSRAVETAEIIASVHTGSTLTADPALRFFRQDRNRFLEFFKTKKMKKKQMRKEVTEDSVAYLKELSKKHIGETVVIVTHARIVKRVLMTLSGKKSSEVMIGNGGIARILGDGITLSIEE